MLKTSTARSKKVWASISGLVPLSCNLAAIVTSISLINRTPTPTPRPPITHSLRANAFSLQTKPLPSPSLQYAKMKPVVGVMQAWSW